MNIKKVVTAALKKGFLAISGLIAAGIAVAIWTVPGAFYGAYNIDLGGDVNLINELKAPAGVLFVAGIVIFAGSVRNQFASVSMTIAALLYLSFGASRVSSFVIDGMPNDGLVSAAILEIAIGAIAAIVVIAKRKQSAI